jgi:hypothetical protein
MQDEMDDTNEKLNFSDNLGPPKTYTDILEEGKKKEK